LTEREFDPKAKVAPNIRAAVFPDDLNCLLSRGAPKQYFPQHILPGEFAFVYDEGHGPKGMVWISSAYFETYDYDWLQVTMGEGDINGRYGWIDPLYRGRGILPKLNIAMDAVRAMFALSASSTLSTNARKRRISMSAIAGSLILYDRNFLDFAW
jgi:hypothetical protein